MAQVARRRGMAQAVRKLAFLVGEQGEFRSEAQDGGVVLKHDALFRIGAVLFDLRDDAVYAVCAELPADVVGIKFGIHGILRIKKRSIYI